MAGAGKSVLFISPQPFFVPRGSPIRVRFDVQALGELGHRIDLLTLPVGEDQFIANVEILRAPNPFGARHVPIGPSLWKVAFAPLLLARALRLTSHQRYDVVHCVEDAGFIGALVRKFWGCRFVFEKHSEAASYRRGPLRNLLLRLYQGLETWCMKHADAIITGPGVVGESRAAVPGGNFHTLDPIPSSFIEADPDQIGRLRGRLKRTDQDVLVCYVGSFAIYQGIELLFESIPIVVRARPEVRFIVIGGTQADIDERQKWLADRDIGHSVVFLGTMDPDSIPAHLSACDILLSPRIAGRTNPTKVFDYLRAGRAICATDHAANRLILDESTSMLTQATSAAFAEGILRLVADPELRERLAANGRTLVEERYSYEEFKQRLAACYADLAPLER